MARKGENIFKRKDGRWEGRYIKGHENGRAIYGYVFGKSYSEAKKKKSEALALLPKKQKQKTTEQPLVREIALQWLDELKAVRRKSTIAKYEGQLRNYIIPFFGNKPINEINNENIVKFSRKLLTEDGKKLSGKTVSDILSKMRGIRKFAIVHGYEVKYVADCFEIPQKQERIRVLSLEEETKLLDYLKRNLDLTSLGIILSLFTGVRLGELCALKWSDFSFEEKVLKISKTMQRLPNPDKEALKKTLVEIGEPKSQNSIRIIPIPEKILGYLQEAYKEDSYILSGKKYYFIEPRTMENRFKAILKKCGIKDVNFHALRHTFATRCIEVGFDVKTLSEILGHASVNITLNRYIHPTMKTKQENMNKLNKLFSQSKFQSENS